MYLVVGWCMYLAFMYLANQAFMYLAGSSQLFNYKKSPSCQFLSMAPDQYFELFICRSWRPLKMSSKRQVLNQRVFTSWVKRILPRTDMFATSSLENLKHTIASFLNPRLPVVEPKVERCRSWWSGSGRWNFEVFPAEDCWQRRDKILQGWENEDDKCESAEEENESGGQSLNGCGQSLHQTAISPPLFHRGNIHHNSASSTVLWRQHCLTQKHQ